MKRTISSFCMLFIAGMIYGQAQEGTVEYQKNQQPAAVIELAYTPDIVNAAMNDYLSKKGKSRGTDLKGFTTFRNTQLVQADSVNADLYFKVERKSRKEKEVSVVSLLLTAPKEGTGVPDNKHYLNMEDAKAYLNGLALAIEAYGLESQIKMQNEAVIKAESKYKSLADDGIDLQKKKESYEKKIEDNKRDQQAQLAEVENQKQKLAAWVNRRKS
ncbi:MAG TPA: hypothetical protein VLD19_01390 [Chitinophagaceae bacterium]|nr:hypothetical protein [Chitinophagaceae bacterium]